MDMVEITWAHIWVREGRVVRSVGRGSVLAGTRFINPACPPRPSLAPRGFLGPKLFLQIPHLFLGKLSYCSLDHGEIMHVIYLLIYSWYWGLGLGDCAYEKNVLLLSEILSLTHNAFIHGVCEYFYK